MFYLLVIIYCWLTYLLYVLNRMSGWKQDVLWKLNFLNPFILEPTVVLVCSQISPYLNFRWRQWVSLLLGLPMLDPLLSHPSTSSEIFQNTCMGVVILWPFSTFSPNQRILSTYYFFPKQNKNCGHYACPASTKIVLTIFACHLHNSSGMCLHLAQTNIG